MTKAAFLNPKRMSVRGRSMAYVEMGEGDAIVFLHGNPTSSYLWRHTMPRVAHLGRCLAPDLIGMGHSEKLPDPGPDTYSFQVHGQHLDSLLEALDIGGRVTLVLHDWGAALGFDWAMRHADRVRGIVYMEALVRPFSDWSDWQPNGARLFQAFRSPDGEAMILDRNLFIERVLPGSIIRALSDDELAIYRKPFEDPPSRWPTLTWPRSIPVAGEPADITAIIDDYAAWLAQTPIRKLLVSADPGAILTGESLAFARRFPNQREVQVNGIHFIQEDSGAEIGDAIANWLTS